MKSVILRIEKGERAVFEIAIWCENTILKQQLEKLIAQSDDLHLAQCASLADILVVDVSDEVHPFHEIEKEIRSQSKRSICILLAKDASMLLELVGIPVYQYILYKDLFERFPACLTSCIDFLKSTRSVYIHKGGETNYLHFCDILYLAYEEGEIFVYTKQQRIATQYASLEKVKQLLPGTFYLINRNVIVHIEAIDKLQGMLCILKNGKCFTISRRRRHGLTRFLQERSWHV